MRKACLPIAFILSIGLAVVAGAKMLEVVFSPPGDFEARETDYGWMVGPPGTDLVRIEKCGSKCQKTWPQYFTNMSNGSELYLFTVFINNRWKPVATTSPTSSHFLENDERKTGDLMWWDGTSDHVWECKQLHDGGCNGECLGVDCKTPAGAGYAVYKRAQRVLR